MVIVQCMFCAGYDLRTCGYGGIIYCRWLCVCKSLHFLDCHLLMNTAYKTIQAHCGLALFLNPKMLKVIST